MPIIAIDTNERKLEQARQMGATQTILSGSSAAELPTGLDFTASGLAYWGNDIGGWQKLPVSHTPERTPLLDPSDARGVIGHYDDYPELIARWYEYATFTPTMRAHGERSETEVWSYGNSYYIERIAQLERVLANKP